MSKRKEGEYWMSCTCEEYHCPCHDELAAERERYNEMREAYRKDYEAERAARLRAEAGAAVMREVMENIAALAIDSTAGEYARIYQIQKWCSKALSTDTGARLAELLEEVRGMPCEWQTKRLSGLECRKSHSSKDGNWCLRCRLHEALGLSERRKDEGSRADNYKHLGPPHIKGA